MALVSPQLLKLLACPVCKQRVQLRKHFLVCARCGKAYPILQGVPDMLPEEAWPLAKARKSGFAHRLTL